MKFQLVLASPSACSPRTRITGISASKMADIALLDRNLLWDIATTRALHAVIFKADHLDHDALDAMLAPVRARVAAREAKDH